MQNLMQCRDSNLSLPKLNDAEDNPYLQKTAIDLRRIELEKVEEVFTQLNESNFTMDKELEELNCKLHDNNQGNIASSKHNITTIGIPPETLIIYIENETAPLPEVIINLLSAIGNSQDEWYIYGVKNPESFYKSFMLLTQLDFIIKNKTEKKNEVATFKREMALHYETYYKTLEYRKLRLPHYDMIHKLTSMDNYCGYDAIRFLCDYCQVNIILLDIIERKYLDVRYTSNKLVPNVIKKTHLTNEFIIIIKYVSETYLPLMNSNGNHIFTQDALDWISRNYERLVVDKFKEPILEGSEFNDSKDFQYSCDNNENEEYYSAALGDANELNLSDIEEPAEPSLENRDELGNFLDSKTVSVFFNNTIPAREQEINMNPIIKAGQFAMAIEDMIEISEEPLGNTSKTITNIVPQKKNEFETLLDKIPTISVDITSNKSGKNCNTKSKNSKTDKTTIQPKPTTQTASTLTSPKENLKPIKAYNLLDLQMLARLYKIDTQKDGKAEKKVNKTKEELYSEIKQKLNK